MTRAVLLLVVALAGRVAAHSFDPAVLDLREREPGVFDVLWRSPAAAAMVVPGGAPAPRFPPSCRAEAAAAPIDDGPQHLRLDCRPGGLRGQELRIDGMAGTHVDAVIRIGWLDGGVTTGVTRSGDDRFVVPGVGNGVPAGALVRRYVREGAARLFAPDHLLFVIGLLLLVERTGVLLRTVAAFSLAHSVTLAAAGLGALRLPPAPVEAAIALGIVLLATELARPPAPPTLTRRAPWLVAFGFGLLHGIGLAGALAQLGLPADQAPLALAAFNGGVELAEAAFVLAMLPAVAAWRRRARRPLWRLAPAYLLGSVAMAWTIERVLAFGG